MTREQAIEIIRKEYACVDADCDIERSCGKCELHMPSKEPILKAYEMAIQALSQEPISLNDINNALEASFRNGVRSAKVEQEPCEDAISHKVIEYIKADIEAARYGLINDGLDVALRIIDKHTEGR